jgi:hypothetical protein
MHILKTSSLLLTFALLASCGGGGGGGGGTVGTTDSSTTVSTGVFVDSPVIDIDYVTSSQSGKTNANGEFKYIEGEEITFRVGAVQLPAVKGNATVTPLDIAKTTDPNNQISNNILIFLQSLDVDGNPQNGITIPESAKNSATESLNFNVTVEDFRADQKLTRLVASSGSVTKAPISADVARKHFEDTLRGNVGNVKINVAPAADAGAAQNVLTGTTVTLDGSKSSDANGDLITYSWKFTSKPAGSNAVLTNSTSAKPAFTADLAGSYVASLIVNDGKLNSTAVTVTVTSAVANVAPVADAGTAQNVLTGTTVTLDGSKSSDANRDLLNYAWTFSSKPAGSNAVLTNSTSANPTFTSDISGSYVASLIVNDGKLNSTAVSVTVTAAVANVAPVANAGVAQSVNIGTTVTLDGSKSSDANSDLIAYAWMFTSKPSGSNASITNPTTAKPTFTADIAGVYVASLSVNDGKLSSNAATVSITAAVSGTAVFSGDVCASGGIAFDTYDRVYFSCKELGVIVRRNLDKSPPFDEVIADGLSAPLGLAVALDGTIYVAESGSHRIRRISPTGVVTNFAGSTAGDSDGTRFVAKFNTPTDVKLDSKGNIYVSDSLNKKVKRITSSGDVISMIPMYMGVNQYKFQSIRYLMIDANDILYTAGDIGVSIHSIYGTNLMTSTAGGRSIDAGFAVDKMGNIYIADSSSWRMPVTGGAGGRIWRNEVILYQSQDYNGIWNPKSIAIDSQGSIYVANGSNSIWKISP